MEFVNKKTIELTTEDFEQIADLFECVYSERRPVEVFKNLYVNNAFGTSYHTLMYEDGHLIGHNAGTPGYMILNGKKMSSLNNVDLFIRKECRGIGGFMSLMKKSWAYYREQGIQLIYSLPNNNSHPLLVKLKFVKDVVSLYTYCLPYRIGGVKPSLKFANILSEFFCLCWVYVSSLFATSKPIRFKVQRDYETFLPTRWNRGDGEYSFGKVKGVEFVYKIKVHEGVRTAFIIDIVSEKSQRAFNDAVKYLLKKESANFDMILYVGYLPFINPGLIRIPHKFEPKNFNFVATILDGNGIDELDKAYYMDVNSWDINLADDDII